MLEAEAEAEAAALARGEQPYLVLDAPVIDGVSGGPLLDAEGAMVSRACTLFSQAARDARRARRTAVCRQVAPSRTAPSRTVALSQPSPLSRCARQVGIVTRTLSVGGDSRYYAVSARRARRAIEAMVERRSLGEQVSGVRVVLRNDSVNKRERVAAVLAAVGLSEQVRSTARAQAGAASHVVGCGSFRLPGG
jgi:hypothetical protein